MSNIRVSAEYDILFEEPEAADYGVWFEDVFSKAMENDTILAYCLNEIEESHYGIRCLHFSVDMAVPNVSHTARGQIARIVLNDIVNDSDVRVLWVSNLQRVPQTA